MGVTSRSRCCTSWNMTTSKMEALRERSRSRSFHAPYVKPGDSPRALAGGGVCRRELRVLMRRQNVSDPIPRTETLPEASSAGSLTFCLRVWLPGVQAAREPPRRRHSCEARAESIAVTESTPAGRVTAGVRDHGRLARSRRGAAAPSHQRFGADSCTACHAGMSSPSSVSPAAVMTRWCPRPRRPFARTPTPPPRPKRATCAAHHRRCVATITIGSALRRGPTIDRGSTSCARVIDNSARAAYTVEEAS